MDAPLVLTYILDPSEEFSVFAFREKVINLIKKIMVFAKPSLTDVKMDPETDYVVIKSDSKQD